MQDKCNIEIFLSPDDQFPRKYGTEPGSLPLDLQLVLLPIVLRGPVSIKSV